MSELLASYSSHSATALQPNRSKKHPANSQNDALKLVRIKWVHVYTHSSVKLTEHRGHVQLFTNISAKHQLDVIHLEVSGMLLLPKYMVIAECMAMPAVLMCNCHTSVISQSNNLTAFQASHFRAPRLLVFNLWLSGGRVKSQAHGHVDPPVPER